MNETQEMVEKLKERIRRLVFSRCPTGVPKPEVILDCAVEAIAEELSGIRKLIESRPFWNPAP